VSLDTINAPRTTKEGANWMFQYRVMNVGTELSGDHPHPHDAAVRTPDGSRATLPVSVILGMIDRGHSFVRAAPEEGLVRVSATHCDACGVRTMDYDGSEAERQSRPLLTRREQEILSLLSQGLTNRQISDGLWISEGTVKAHISNLFRKLGVNNRTQAVVMALAGPTTP
jgi:DNA-binding CsgD family transcriptional regulator